jgi:hypothetical protein
MFDQFLGRAGPGTIGGVSGTSKGAAPTPAATRALLHHPPAGLVTLPALTRRTGKLLRRVALPVSRIRQQFHSETSSLS